MSKQDTSGLPVPAGSAAVRAPVVCAGLPLPDGALGCHRSSETVAIGGLLPDVASI